jgi:adenylate kinase
VLLDISNEEAVSRLLKRKRSDDTEESIKERLSWFEENVGPAITYYEGHGRLHRVDGMGTIEDVAERIAQSLGI